MMRRILYLIIFIVATLPIYAQPNCFFTHYSSEDGLSQNTVMSILQDHKGNLWFATWDGLNKFNGYSFKTYKARQGNLIGLTNNRIDQVYEDNYGCLWLQTNDNRAHRFDPRTETFEQVPAATEEGGASNVRSIQVLTNGTVWVLTENDGAIRVTTDPQTLRLTTTVYSVQSGLFPASRVFKVHLDKSGHEWMLTDNGLAMITPGKHSPVSYFVETKEGPAGTDQAFYTALEQEDEICFGSDKGRVWRYQKRDGQFRLLELPTASRIVSIDAMKPGTVILTTATDGFFTYQPKDGAYTHYSHITCRDLPDAPILSVYVDRASEVWFEQEEAGVVAHFNPFTGVLKREQIRVEPTSADRARPAFHIFEDTNGYLWVHPYGGGFSYFDRQNNCLTPFYDELGSRDWRFSNKLHAAFSDRQGNLWLCSHSKGLEKVSFRSVQFSMLTPSPHTYESLSNETRSLYEDKSGNLWVGLKDGMLRVYDKQRLSRGYLTESGVVAHVGTPMRGTVYSLTEDRHGVLWIGTKGDGLVKAEATHSPLHYRLTRYQYEADNMYSLSNDNIYSVYEDHKGRIWIATFGGGINYLSTDAGGKTLFINHRNNLKGYPIDLCYKTRVITSDDQGSLWVGTTAGALAFDEDFRHAEDVKFRHYMRVSGQEESLSNNDVHWIIATRKKELFLATFGGGLNKLLSKDRGGKGVFKSYTVHDGLPSDVLLSIREDGRQNLWISTENGVSKFIPSQEKFENYDDASITFRVRFSEAASERTASGAILFGASNGVFRFHPDSIRKSDYVPSIIFSKLVIANEDVLPGQHSLLKVGLDDTPELRLSHRENVFAIQYAALDYTNPANIRYAYLLEGFEKQWTYADKQRSATYTNLPKGKYTFKVRSTNSDGVWVENTRSLPIVVLPSFWETPFAYALYVLLMLLIILVAVYILFTIYRLKHEVSVEQQVSDIKLRFFTNISHELRTPLTLIAGPVECVLKNAQLPEDAREQLLVVERNTSRMLRLVNQILDFRKIQNKKMKMRVQRVDVVAFARQTMSHFEAMAEQRHIDFLIEAEKDALFLWVDADKFEKIIFNLLSNAFKYTPNGKSISLFIREDEATICVGVQDQGIGIADHKKSSIFVRFENLVDKNLFNQASTGIGLSLVKELVEMHKASIIVESKLGEGSCFRVDFLKGKAHYDPGTEFILDDATSSLGGMEAVTEINRPRVSTIAIAEDQPEHDSTSKEVMLLVEDNDELRFFLRSIFTSSYRVIEAVDGLEGWSKALQFLPDMIVSDVMMPGKDGLELTRELRAHMTTSHIPIVLLTAKTSIESKLEGLEYGADDYITKPFSATYLKARVGNLLARRRQLQALYRDHLMSDDTSTEQPTERGPELSVNDRKFMDKLIALMEQHMDNGDLVVDDLVREVAVSRSVFFKKLKTLTGLAPIEFIKEMRMKRAVRLMENGEFNITQISYMVGINDPRYFSKCFKQQMGMTPTEYKEQRSHPPTH